MTAQTSTSLALLPLEVLRESSLNPRRHYDETKLQELAASIHTQGILQPLVVRPHPRTPATYEIVAGARRYRAALRTDRRPLEHEVQQRVKAVYRAAGCYVANLSQGYRPGGRRHGTTRQTRGLPDLWVMCDRRRAAWWHEVKRPGGKQTPEQIHFQLLTLSCGIPYVLGGVPEAIAQLRSLGLVADSPVHASTTEGTPQ